jgi:hypothetical protein
MTAPIEDVSSLPGRKVTDQEEIPIGEVKEIYAIDGDGYPMWVAVEVPMGGTNDKRTVFIPLARLKDEDGDLRVPYSKDRIADSPEVDGSDGISEECDRKLRSYYGIGTGDQEMYKDNKSYATLVPDEEGTAKRVEDVDELETPNADTRTDESKERLQDAGSADTREIDAGAIADENAENSGEGGGGGEGKQDEKDDKEEQDDAEGKDQKDDKDD